MAGILDVLDELVSINSVFPKERRLAEHAERRLRGSGFRVERQYIEKGRFNVLADNGKRGMAMLFYAHLDTVPIYGDWRTDPLRVTEKGDKVYGLGVTDMKGGMAAVLNNAADSDRHIKVLLCADEENISKGAWMAMQKRRAWFKDVSICISGEPATSRETITGRSNITIGRRGRTVISVDVTGLSAHGYEHGSGISALTEASKLALHVDDLKLRSADGFGQGSAFVRELSSASTSLAVPDRAHLEMDFHLVPRDTIEGTRRQVQQLVNKLIRNGTLDRRARFAVSVVKRETPYNEPYASDLRDRNVKRVFSAAQSILGKPRVRYGMSVADDNVIANQLGIPVLIIGPDGGSIHSANEWAYTRSLQDLDRLYAELMRQGAV